MASPAIVVEQLSKKFRRGQRHDSLRDLIPATARMLLGRSSSELEAQEFWALRDVSFSVGEGDALGIIGPNGAGKSTLLKLLTRILRPTSGRCRVRGRIGALIEIAAGFHPDLTGRENVYLQGAIMGMTRAEIAAKFDRIVEFSGVGDFITTPVKRYSSGMNARLGFAIAAHLDPDVLLVDEVLSVGDAGFQERCLARMRELTARGVPLVFITHNLSAVAELCTRAIVLEGGRVRFDGDPSEAIGIYRRPALAARAERPANATVWIEHVELLDADGLPSVVFRTGGAFRVRVHYRTSGEIPRPHFGIDIHRGEGTYCAGINTQIDGVRGGPLNGAGYVELQIGNLSLLPGSYTLSAGILDPDLLRPIDLHQYAYPFSIASDRRELGLVRLDRTWRHEIAEADAPVMAAASR